MECDCATTVTRGAARPGEAPGPPGTGGEADAPAVSPVWKTSLEVPRLISSPSRSRSSATRLPLTKVPLEEPRSRRM